MSFIPDEILMLDWVGFQNQPYIQKSVKYVTHKLTHPLSNYILAPSSPPYYLSSPYYLYATLTRRRCKR